MNAQAPAPVAEVEIVPLDHLMLDPLNTRQTHNADEIAALAESIDAVGLLQNLCGLHRADGKIGIVAGGRRLAALELLAERGNPVEAVPVRIVADAVEAELVSHSENSARKALHPAEEVRAFRRLSEQGLAESAVAKAFGVTEGHVKRRMKLATLPEAVIDALHANIITLDVASAFTVSPSPEQTASVLAMVHERVGKWGEMDASDVRRHLLQDGVEDTDRRVRFIGLDAYEAAGGAVTRDLFSETVSLDDPALVDSLVQAKLDATVVAQIEAGWLWAEVADADSMSWDFRARLERKGWKTLHRVPGSLTDEEQAEYDELGTKPGKRSRKDGARLDALAEKRRGAFTDEQKAVAGVFVAYDFRGDLELVEALVRPDDVAQARAAGVIETAKKADGDDDGASKALYSGKLTSDLKAIQLAAAQAALVKDADLAFDVLAFVMGRAPNNDLYYERFLSITPHAPDARPEKDEAFALPDTMEAMASDTAFADFRDRPDAERMAALIGGVARMLLAREREGVPFGHLGITPDLRTVWRPTASNFFGRIAVPQLDAIHEELTGVDPEYSLAKTCKAMKKGAKAALLEDLFTAGSDARKLYALDDAALAKVDAWVPEGF